MFPLCGDFEFADTSEPYESAGNFLCIDHWIVNFANCVGKKINRIKIAILHVMHTSSAIYSDISVYVIRYIFLNLNIELTRRIPDTIMDFISNLSLDNTYFKPQNRVY